MLQELASVHLGDLAANEASDPDCCDRFFNQQGYSSAWRFVRRKSLNVQMPFVSGTSADTLIGILANSKLSIFGFIGLI